MPCNASAQSVQCSISCDPAAFPRGPRGLVLFSGVPSFGALSYRAVPRLPRRPLLTDPPPLPGGGERRLPRFFRPDETSGECMPQYPGGFAIIPAPSRQQAGATNFLCCTHGWDGFYISVHVEQHSTSGRWTIARHRNTSLSGPRQLVVLRSSKVIGNGITGSMAWQLLDGSNKS
jgi:hypothetical protein